VGGEDACGMLISIIFSTVPGGLRRIHGGGGNLHFISTSCYRRDPTLGSGRSRDLFLEIFEQVRRKYYFQVIGFVVMPEHIHLLIREPKQDTVSIAVQVLKQRVARRLLRKPIRIFNGNYGQSRKGSVSGSSLLRFQRVFG